MYLMLVAAMTATAAFQPPEEQSMVGRWVNPDHSVIVDIAPCESDLCGTVQWATEQAKQDARRGTPDLIGLKILTDLRQQGDVWKGNLFVPDQDLHAEAKLELDGDELKVSGCEVFICKSQLWTRSEGPLPNSE